MRKILLLLLSITLLTNCKEEIMTGSGTGTTIWGWKSMEIGAEKTNIDLNIYFLPGSRAYKFSEVPKNWESFNPVKESSIERVNFRTSTDGTYFENPQNKNEKIWIEFNNETKTKSLIIPENDTFEKRVFVILVTKNIYPDEKVAFHILQDGKRLIEE